jgi:hypothetical protein
MHKLGDSRFNRHAITVTALSVLLQMTTANAIQFNLDYGSGIEGTLNTSLVAGANWRAQERSTHLVGKANNNPDLCGGANQSCQAVFRDQVHPSQALAAGVGQSSINGDDGNLNYNKGDLISGLVRVNQDLKLSYGDFGFFAKTLYFYDFVNNDFTEYHPNRLTTENAGRTGNLNDPLFGTAGTRVYGAGEVVRSQRNDGEVLRQIGTDLQLLDAFFYGTVAMPGDRTLTVKLGRQTVNWGQTTVLPINSVNQANAVNANNFNRVGFTLEDLFVPTGMLFMSTEPFEGATLEGFYGYEWKPVEAPAPGSYFSPTDVGSNNAINYASISFGGPAEDPDSVGFPLANPLNGVTNSTTTIQRLEDNEARSQGQYGVSFRYYAETLNNGTEFGLFFMNYHSKLPYASFVSTNASCARREGNDLGIDAYDPFTFLLTCNDLPVLHPTDPENATSNAVDLDHVRFFLDYPEDIKMFGASFATTLGDYSVQGEVAYRPELPLQVALVDLTFGALNPTLSRCHDRNLPRLATNVDLDPLIDVVNGVVGQIPFPFPVGVPNLSPSGTGCTGTTAGLGVGADGSEVVYGSSDHQNADGSIPYRDTFDLAIGAAPGSARSFPSFVTTYRGYAAGEYPANTILRGYEKFESFQFNLGLTKVIGATDNWFAADQIIMLYEFGANYSDLPPIDQLQIEGPGTYYHASAGADGSGADQSQLACAGNPACSFGPDGLRFNPHQQDRDLYADKFSWGYRVVSIIKYESVLPGISLQPFIIWEHGVNGTMPGPGESFVEGRKKVEATIEIRYKAAFSVTPGYTWFTGGGAANVLRDRDFAQLFFRYQF